MARERKMWWVDSTEELAQRLLGDPDTEALTIFWDQKANAIGMVTTCSDQEALAECLEHCAKRVRSGEHAKHREEVRS